jgi:hypothetical protein
LRRIVVGSSLAALVAVNVLSRKGPVTWVKTNPYVGGHFAGIKQENLFLDLGMVLLEPFSNGDGEDFSKKEVPIKQTGLKHVGKIFSWLNEKGESFLPVEIQAKVNGSFYNDYLIADNLDFLRGLRDEEKSIIAGQINQIIDSPLLPHPRLKNIDEKFLNLNLSFVQTNTVGDHFFTNYVNSWLKRINSSIGEKLCARDHRLAWIPFYFPETIKEALFVSGSSSLENRPFWVPAEDTIAGLVNKIQGNLTIENIDFSVFSADLLDSRNEIYFFTSVKETAQLLDIKLEDSPSQLLPVSLVIVTLMFSASLGNEKVVNVIEDEIGPYRYTLRNLRADNLVTVISIEFGEEFIDFDDELIVKLGSEFISKEGFQSDYVSAVVSRPIIRLPYGDSRVVAEANRDLVHNRLQNYDYLGYPIDFGSSSFNDQMLLALWSTNE